MVSFYDIFMFPLEKYGIKKSREILIPKAKGTVLEIGSGTGVNLKHYQFDQIERMIVSDKVLGKHLLKRVPNFIEKQSLDVEELPFEDNMFDFIIHTLVFCSVDDVTKGIQELKRVLKPEGTILFIEHVLPEKAGLRRLFNWINPAWRKFASGCNLNRDYLKSLEVNGFAIRYQRKFLRTVFICGEAQINILDNEVKV